MGQNPAIAEKASIFFQQIDMFRLFCHQFPEGFEAQPSASGSPLETTNDFVPQGRSGAEERIDSLLDKKSALKAESVGHLVQELFKWQSMCCSELFFRSL